jgi:hypothetical protein
MTDPKAATRAGLSIDSTGEAHMAQTHVLAAHLDTHGDLIADPDTPSEHLIATFEVEAFETLWEPKGWVAVNRAGEAVPDLEQADPDRVDDAPAEQDRAKLRAERARKFTRSSRRASGSEKSEG